MARADRRRLLGELGKARGDHLVISYITSTRTGFEVSIADDVIPIFYDHLEAAKERAKVGVDLFIHSNGGSGTAPWRIVNLIREYTERFSVLVPHRAFSAATLIALGADEIVMHRMGCLGPIDPSVANIFNPPNPQNPAVPAPISVEDVTAYFKMVREEVSINHEDELIQAFIALTEKVHPLALGNVQRSHSQSRMLARKLLKKHLAPEREHEIDTIIDNLKSNLYFHGHPINRTEAREDLKLKADIATPEVERLMWELYLQYDEELKLREPYNPLHELKKQSVAAPQQELTIQQILQQLGQLQAAGVQMVPGNEEQVVRLATALANTIGVKSGKKVDLNSVPGAFLESETGTDVFLTDLTIERAVVNTPSGPQDATKQEVSWQRWEREKP